ncbi:MAG: aminoacyl-tRNA hydrolase [Magnetococcus sp. WYHC-3]
MKLVVGLGNPGENYRETRHNLGWESLERMIHRYRWSRGVARFQGQFGDGLVGETRVYWLMPLTYMNLSGRAVAEALRFFKLDVADLVVLHDDMDLALGRLKIKRGGGNAGHNGLKSIQQTLGSGDFVRVRLGIGRPPEGHDPARFVLQRFTAVEREMIDAPLDRLAAALPLVLAGDYTGAMTRVALQPAVAPPQTTPPSS